VRLPRAAGQAISRCGRQRCDVSGRSATRRARARRTISRAAGARLLGSEESESTRAGHVPSAGRDRSASRSAHARLTRASAQSFADRLRHFTAAALLLMLDVPADALFERGLRGHRMLAMPVGVQSHDLATSKPGARRRGPRCRRLAEESPGQARSVATGAASGSAIVKREPRSGSLSSSRRPP
jgi:hypothetical protein